MKKNADFVIRKLSVSAETRVIISELSLTIAPGSFHVVMGPNGSGKSTLTYALMGHPAYTVSGKIMFAGKNLIDLAPEERAKLGILLAFQNPMAVPGVSVNNFLKTSYQSLYPKEKISALEFHKLLMAKAADLSVDPNFLKRSINDGFSGGEKKKMEMLQLLILRPKIAIFDEIDTGLDVDALKIVSKGINMLHEKGTAVLLITHYQRILNYLHPEFVHIMKQGAFVKEGGTDLIEQIEKNGYAAI